MAATNKYDLLDGAIKERFLDGQCYFPLPDEKQIKALLKLRLSALEKAAELVNNEEQIDILSSQLIGYSNRAIVGIIKQAGKIAKRESRMTGVRGNITFEHLKTAIEQAEFEKSDEKEYKNKKKKPKIIGFGK